MKLLMSLLVLVVLARADVCVEPIGVSTEQAAMLRMQAEALLQKQRVPAGCTNITQRLWLYPLSGTATSDTTTYWVTAIPTGDNSIAAQVSSYRVSIPYSTWTVTLRWDGEMAYYRHTGWNLKHEINRALKHMKGQQ